MHQEAWTLSCRNHSALITSLRSSHCACFNQADTLMEVYEQKGELWCIISKKLCKNTRNLNVADAKQRADALFRINVKTIKTLSSAPKVKLSKFKISIATFCCHHELLCGLNWNKKKRTRKGNASDYKSQKALKRETTGAVSESSCIPKKSGENSLNFLPFHVKSNDRRVSRQLDHYLLPSDLIEG
jgi:hypothetical protein